MTSHDVTSRTAEDLRAEAARYEQAASDSFDRCDTDGFLSQWASGITARLLRRQAELAEAGGRAMFLALFTTEGEWVPAKTITTHYGTRWMVLDAEGVCTGEFLPFMPKRRDTLAKKGYVEGWVMRPAAAKLMGSVTGLSGCASVYVGTYALDDDWAQPAEVVTVDRWAVEA